MRFHLSPRTGNPNICRAKSCQVQPEDHHYGSSSEAEAARRSLLEKARISRVVEPGELNPLTGFLRDDYASLTVPQGVSCPHCFREIDHRAAASLLKNLPTSCQCGESYGLGTVYVDTAEMGFDHEAALAMRWYHATDMSDWTGSVHGSSDYFEAHIGTEAAAFDRGIGRYATHRAKTKSFYLYEVSLDPSVSLFPLPLEDENESLLFDEAFDAVPYVNLWEDMASISLAVRSDLIIIESMREVTVEEAHRRVSLCNLKDSWS